MLDFSLESPLWLVVSVFAAWRLTGFVLYDDGPFGLAVCLRKVLVRVRLGRMIDCFHCTSMWAALVVALVTFAPSWALILAWWGIAGGASALELFLGAPPRYLNTTMAEEMREDSKEIDT